MSDDRWLEILTGVRGLENDGKSQAINQSTEPPKDEYEAIQFLHKLLDEDLSGYVDVRESKEVWLFAFM